MKTAVTGGALAVLSATGLQAGGIERMPQSAMILYETGTHLEFSLGRGITSVTGENGPLYPPQDLDDVSGDFWLPAIAFKTDLTDRLAMAVTYDRPFGADVAYEDGNIPFGGTTADAATDALTALLKYRINDNFSAFGGLRYQKAQGDIHLRGAAYGPVSGYDISLDTDYELGYVAGVAYERPDIALRVALTYNSAISHDMDTTESGPLIDPDGPGPLPAMPLLNGSSTTEVTTPESWNLEFQTGIAQDTLLFGSIRHVKHSQFKVDADRIVAVTGAGLIDLDDTTAYKIGLGRQLTDRFAGSVAVTYEPGGDELLSPLSPTTGYTQLTVGGAYDVTESMTVSGGVSYTRLGDGKPFTAPGIAQAEFSDNSAVGFGLKVAMKF
ncbi:OmpP1/FadL family transporter [Salipiger mucosus]|uniref:Outer membrane transporter, OMPP1/FadL/TodX family n=1 Tax=Salipiger mucosus DSM 16094 TaxID=1123237 RepID=S9RDJ3_9RHOB|nr:outer membrane protein transport protein [Salipiger mucosus]EPX76200.1 Outer membrane transporter, OMPP1/FadL/TodX family [Salipiger mucosus DSM 16094]